MDAAVEKVATALRKAASLAGVGLPAAASKAKAIAELLATAGGGTGSATTAAHCAEQSTALLALSCLPSTATWTRQWQTASWTAMQATRRTQM